MALSEGSRDKNELLTGLMSDPNADMRAAAASWLRMEGSNAIPLVRPLLMHSDPRTREVAARLLGELFQRATNSGVLVRDLVGALSDDDERVRLAAALSLDNSRVHLPAALPILAKAIREPDGFDDTGRAWNAARALGRIGAPAVETLTKILQDKDAGPVARRLAALSLGRIGAPAVRGLTEAVGHPEIEVRRLAAMGLSASPPDGLLMARWDLAKALEDGDARVREQCAYAWGFAGLPDPAVAHRLARMAEADPVSAVREASAWAVGYVALGLPDDMRRLIKALDDPDASVRTGAAFALGSSKKSLDGPVAALRKALQDENAVVRETAARAIGRMARRCSEDTRQTVRAALKDAVQDSDHDVKRASKIALTAIDWSAHAPLDCALRTEVWNAFDSTKAKGYLAILAADDPESIQLMQMVLNACAVWPKPPLFLEKTLYLVRDGKETAHWAAQELARLASVEDRYECDADVMAALASVGRPARPATLDCIWILCHDNDVRAMLAVDALANMWQDGPILVDLMAEGLRHPNVDVRIRAAERLAEACPGSERAARLLRERLADEYHTDWFDAYVQERLWWDRSVPEERLKVEIKKATERYREAISGAIAACRKNRDADEN